MLNQKDDVEATGTDLLYPLMEENPEFRGAFIRKVYSILTVQLLVTIACGALVVKVHPIALFFSTTWSGVMVYISILIVPIIVLWFLSCFKRKHPWNFFLLGIFTLCFGFILGLLCAFISGKLVLEAVIATAAVVISLTIYTFWAAKKGHSFGFLVPFLWSVLIVLIVFTIFQIFFPWGKISEIIYGGVSAIVFCAYIIYDTNNLIKKNTYDEYIWASVCLYLDILNLFSDILQVLAAVNRR